MIVPLRAKLRSRLEVSVKFHDDFPVVTPQDFVFPHRGLELVAHVPVFSTESCELKRLSNQLKNRGLVVATASESVSFLNAVVSSGDENLIDNTGYKLFNGGISTATNNFYGEERIFFYDDSLRSIHSEEELSSHPSVSYDFKTGDLDDGEISSHPYFSALLSSDVIPSLIRVSNYFGGCRLTIGSNNMGSHSKSQTRLVSIHSVFRGGPLWFICDINKSSFGGNVLGVKKKK